MDFPDLVMIAPHMGGLAWYGEEAVIKYLVEPKFKNLYMDTSKTCISIHLDNREEIDFIMNLQTEIDDKQCGTRLHKEKMKLFYQRFSISDSILLEIINKIGTDKIIFGTDWPTLFQDQEEIKIRNLGLKPEEESQIFYENAARLLQIPPSSDSNE